jgi:hypothetical protein
MILVPNGYYSASRLSRAGLFLFDAGYDRPPLLAWCQQMLVWVVERTLAWLGRSQRLSKDYEALLHMSETMIYLVMTRLMLKPLHPITHTISYTKLTPLHSLTTPAAEVVGNTHK